MSDTTTSILPLVDIFYPLLLTRKFKGLTPESQSMFILNKECVVFIYDHFQGTQSPFTMFNLDKSRKQFYTEI